MLWIHALQLQATRHEKLNLVDSPCNASSDYDSLCGEKRLQADWMSVTLGKSGSRWSTSVS